MCGRRNRDLRSAARRSYSEVIKSDANKIERFDNPLQVKDWVIEEPMDTKLNRLRKSNPEAFFYCYKIYEFESNGN